MTPNPNSENPILTSRIKVLHIISGDLWAGAEVQAFTLITSLQHQCDITVALMNYGELEQRLSLAGVEVIVMDECTLSGWQITKQLVMLIKRFHPDIIHTHRKKENILGSLANILASKNPYHRTKSIRTAHGADEHKAGGIKKIINKLDTFCGTNLQDAIISVSKDLAAKLQNIFPNEKIHIIENGVNVAQLRAAIPAADIRLNYKDYIHIGIIGRLEPVKRADLFIRAAHQMLVASATQAVKLKFHIIGDGKLKDELALLTHQLGIQDEVVFHGHRSDSIQAIAALDMVVMCSDHEGTPMTALETLALERPLIAHDVGGLREILSEMPELLVNEHTPAGYAEKILELIDNPRQVSLKDIYTNTWNATRTLRLYQQVLNKEMSGKLTETPQKLT
ncbi:MAG TPA: glycosyltransferase [Cellvibrio sp.]|nr:glycosyltransferase [Cellvibrio sp.]